MGQKELKIVMLLREVCDPRPPVKVGPGGGRISDRGLRRLLNPADLSALEEARHLAETVGGEVTAVAIGPSRLDDCLRLARAMGATRTIRIWDHGLEEGDPCSDARLYSRLMDILQPELFFSGNRLLDQGDDPSLRLASAQNRRPCINSAVGLSLGKDTVQVERKSDRGARQKVVAPFPCTVLFEADSREIQYPAHQAVMDALEGHIEVWGLPDLGLPGWCVGAAGAILPIVKFGFPRQQPLRTVTPDAQLPAFDRILALLSGGIKPREGKFHDLPPEKTADRLFEIFVAEGLLGEEA